MGRAGESERQALRVMHCVRITLLRYLSVIGAPRLALELRGGSLPSPHIKGGDHHY